MKEPLAQDIDAESDSDDIGMSFKASYKSKHEGVRVTSHLILRCIALTIWPSTCFYRRKKIYMKRQTQFSRVGLAKISNTMTFSMRMFN